MSDESLRAAEAEMARESTVEAQAALKAERARSESPEAARARLRREAREAKALAAEAAGAARATALAAAVEAELDLRAGGPGRPPPSAAGEVQPGRLYAAMCAIGQLAALTPGLAAGPRALIAGANARRASDCAYDPERPDERGRGGRWLRQGGQFLRAVDELAVGAYAYGKNGGGPRATAHGIVLALREVDGESRYYAVASRAEAAAPAATAAYATAQVEVSRLADERERAETGIA